MREDEIIDKKEITTLPLNQKILEYLKTGTLRTILTDDEYLVLDILYSGPKTIRDIRSKIIERIVDEIGENLLNKNESLISKSEIEKDKKVREVLQEDYERFRNLISDYKFGKISYTKYISEMEKIIKKRLKKNIPSYERIKNILDTFFKLGLVAKRRISFKGAKSLWILKPEISEYISKNRFRFTTLLVLTLLLILILSSAFSRFISFSFNII